MEVVFDSAVTVPLVAVTAAEVVRDVCAVRVTFTGAESAADIVTVDAVEVRAMLPAVEVSVAPEFDSAADPESVMSPVALIAPVGSTDVPPVIRTVPEEAVRAPAPA
jgi:hypothetical protein